MSGEAADRSGELEMMSGGRSGPLGAAAVIMSSLAINGGCRIYHRQWHYMKIVSAVMETT